MKKLQQHEKVECMLAVYAAAAIGIYLSGNELGKLLLISSFLFLLLTYIVQCFKSFVNGFTQKEKPMQALIHFFVYYNAFTALLLSLAFLLFIPGAHRLIAVAVVLGAGLLILSVAFLFFAKAKPQMDEARSAVQRSLLRTFILLAVSTCLWQLGMPYFYKMAGKYRSDKIYMQLMEDCFISESRCAAFDKYHQSLEKN